MPSDPKANPDVLHVDGLSKLIHALSYRPERSRPVWRNRHTGTEAVVVDLFVDDNGGFQGGCRRFVVQTDEALPPGPPAPPRKGQRNARCHDLASWLSHWQPVGRWVDWPRLVDEAPTITDSELKVKLEAFEADIEVVRVSAEPSPDERYNEFHKENERWNKRIDRALEAFPEPSPDPLREALDMAIYHADNLRRFIDHKPVRDLAESAAGLERAREALATDQSQSDRTSDEATPAELAYERVTVDDLAVGDKIEWYLIASNEGWEWVPGEVIGLNPLHIRFWDGDDVELRSRDGAKPPMLRRQRVPDEEGRRDG